MDLLHSSAGRGGGSSSRRRSSCSRLVLAPPCASGRRVRTRRTRPVGAAGVGAAWSSALTVVWAVGRRRRRTGRRDPRGGRAGRVAGERPGRRGARRAPRPGGLRPGARPTTATRSTPGRDLLTRLRGKDVLVVFVESYGRVAVEGTWFSPSVDRTLDAGDRTARAARVPRPQRLARPPRPSAAISWLAHSTLSPGSGSTPSSATTRCSSQRPAHPVLGVQAGGLAHRLRRPVRTDSAGREGSGFYGYDQMYDSRNVGYAGPAVRLRARSPTSTRSRAFNGRELRAAPAAPVMAEIDLDLQPHTRGRRSRGWCRGTSSATARSTTAMHDAAHLARPLLARPHAQQRPTTPGRSTTRCGRWSRFVRHAHDKNLVMVVLGDHQPQRRRQRHRCLATTSRSR